MMVRFLSQDGNVMSEEFMGKTDRWDGFQGFTRVRKSPNFIIKFVRLYTSFHSLQFNIKLYGLFILLPRASLLYYYMPGT